MKLDESIELKNKTQNISKMNKTNLSVSEMRDCLHEIMTDENKSNGLYEILVQEGFLPADLNEGEEHGSMCEIMMEDDMVAEEMFKACANSNTDCARSIHEWVSGKRGVAPAQQQQPQPGTYKVTKEQVMSELSPETKYAAYNGAMMKNKGHEENGQDLEANKTMGQANTFATHVDPATQSELNRVAQAFGSDYKGTINKSIAHGGDKKAYAVVTISNGQNLVKIAVSKNGNKLAQGDVPQQVKPMLGRLVKMIQTKEIPDESMELAGIHEMGAAAMSSPAVASDNSGMMDEGDTDRSSAWDIYTELMEAQIDPSALVEYIIGNYLGGSQALEVMAAAKAEFMEGSGEEEMEDPMDMEPEEMNTDDEPIMENELPTFAPVKGKNIDSENKTNAKKDDSTEVAGANKSQKTINQKTEDKINVKFSPDMESDFQKEVNKKALGAWNSLNLDFQNEVPQQFKDRVELEVTTGHSRKRDEKTLGKEANVDHESTERVGKAMVAASKMNQGERDAQYKPNPVVVTDDPYKETSVTGKEQGADKTKHVNEDLEKMKRLFGFEESRLNENKRTTVNEDDVIFKSVSKKTVI